MEEQKDNLILRALSVLHKVSRWVSYGGIAAAIMMMLMVVVDVVLRFVFHKPILGSVEIATYLLSIIAFTAIPLVEGEEMHIAIPLLFDRFPKRLRLVINSLVGLFGLAFLVLLGIASFQLGAEYLHRGKVTQVLSIPLYPFVLIAAFCISLYAVILIFNSIKYIYLRR